MSYYEKRIAELEARIAEMAREQRLKAIPVEAKLLERYALMQAENTRLKAKVDRLRNLGIKLDGYVDLVLHENERLRKAGDAMAEIILKDCIHKNDIAALKWYDAKEGKQS